jgi:hypothetical protein
MACSFVYPAASLFADGRLQVKRSRGPPAFEHLPKHGDALLFLGPVARRLRLHRFEQLLELVAAVFDRGFLHLPSPIPVLHIT